MEPRHYAEFVERLGQKVIENDGLFWIELFSRVWMCCPFESQLNPAEVDVSKIMDSSGVMARYCCNIEHGASSFRHVVTEKNYDLGTLNPKARNQTRQGLENCTSGQVEAKDLRKAGFDLHVNTLQRQGRVSRSDAEAYWKKYFDAIETCPCATMWASWYQGRIAAFLISFRIGSIENISIVRSDDELLKHRPNNAMLFTFLKEALNRPDVTEVCIGLQSLQPGMGSLDLFKRRMGFVEQPVGQRIELRPSLQLAVPKSLALVAGKAIGYVKNEYAARLAGALSCYAAQPSIRRSA